MLDADQIRFTQGLHETRPGLRLRLAIHESCIAAAQIGRLIKLGGPRSASASETWRRAHIAACNRASEAIDQLWDQHQWPADGARNRRYEWRPTANFRR
jgi:hypothetical protein